MYAFLLSIYSVIIIFRILGTLNLVLIFPNTEVVTLLGNWGLFCVIYVYMLVIFNLCLAVLWFESREVGPWCNCQVPSTQKKKRDMSLIGLN